MPDHSLRSVLIFTGVYGVIACALLAGQAAMAPPRAANVQVASASQAPLTADIAALVSVASYDLSSSE
jgi:hypothetical protein